MSVVSAVFNRNTMKLLLALAIPAAIAYFFWYAAKHADEELNGVKGEIKEHPGVENPEISNWAMKEIDDNNNIRWQVIAESGKYAPDGKQVELKKVTVSYFDPQTKELKMRLSSYKGTANPETKYVKLISDGKDKVVAEGSGGKCKFVANTVELIKQNQFLATGGVIIDWPGVAKVSGDQATGSTNMAAGPKDFKVVGNTHAEIAVR